MKNEVSKAAIENHQYPKARVHLQSECHDPVSFGGVEAGLFKALRFAKSQIQESNEVSWFGGDADFLDSMVSGGKVL